MLSVLTDTSQCATRSWARGELSGAELAEHLKLHPHSPVDGRFVSVPDVGRIVDALMEHVEAKAASRKAARPRASRKAAAPTTLAQLRETISAAKHDLKRSQARRLKGRGWSDTAIGRRMGLDESAVHELLTSAPTGDTDILSATSAMLKEQVDAHGFIDVGVGVERHIGISRTKLDAAIARLKERGYEVHAVQIDQMGGRGKTTVKVLAPPGTTYRDIAANRGRIHSILDTPEHGSVGYEPFRPPLSISSERLDIVYAEDGGAEADGVIYVRPGVKDVSLGGGRYAQVRIVIDDTHYIKGMAVYRDDLPPGVDLRFHTAKPRTGKKTDALKPLRRDSSGRVDPELPFGSVIRRQVLEDDGEGGKRVASAMNLVYEEGDWEGWARSLSSQVLSKQSTALAREQLGKLRARRQRDLDEILALTNPAVRAKLLMEFADSADAAAVDLKAAPLTRQATRVILPAGSLGDTEIYAPGFADGERVVLVRHPHGGTFEIPELTVNNGNAEARRLLGDVPDAVAINPRVARLLSGADFDGDTVLVIPNNGGEIATSPPLAGLAGFDPVASYPAHPGMRPISESTQQTQMGIVTNLITDMTIQGASDDEIARAVRHSMVVIDAEKHNLDYKRSEIDHGIAELRAKYQGGRGAATLISRAGAPVDVPDRKPRSARDGGPIDRATGRRVFAEPDTWVDRTGRTRTRMRRSERLAETPDAHTLVSTAGTEMERVYADHSNALKAMAERARREMVATPNVRWSRSAKTTYAARVASLKAKLDEALKNAPVERRAQLLASAILARRMRANPSMDAVPRVRQAALREARALTGARRQRIEITDAEWEAIQAGAVSHSQLAKILQYADPSRVRALAAPSVDVPDHSRALGRGPLARPRVPFDESKFHRVPKGKTHGESHGGQFVESDATFALKQIVKKIVALFTGGDKAKGGDRPGHPDAPRPHADAPPGKTTPVTSRVSQPPPVDLSQRKPLLPPAPRPKLDTDKLPNNLAARERLRAELDAQHRTVSRHPIVPPGRVPTDYRPGRWYRVSGSHPRSVDDLRHSLDEGRSRYEAEHGPLSGKESERFDTYRDAQLELARAHAEDVYVNGDHLVTVGWDADLPDAHREEALRQVDELIASQPPPNGRGVSVHIESARGMRAVSVTIPGRPDLIAPDGITTGSHVLYLNAEALTGVRSARIRAVGDGDFNMPSSKGMNAGIYTLIHEWGHLTDPTDRGVGGSGDPDGVHGAHQVHLSGYGRENPREGYAEAFAEWHNTGGATDNPAVRAYAERYGWSKPARPATKAAPKPRAPRKATSSPAAPVSAKKAVPARRRVGKDLTGDPVRLREVAGTQEQGPHGDEQLYRIAEHQGWLGQPRQVSKAQLDRMIAGGAPQLWRGNDNQDHADRLVGGDVYYGSNAVGLATGHGYGIAAASDRPTARTYGDHLVRMTFQPGTRVIDSGELEDELHEWLDGLPADERQHMIDSGVATDMGRYAAANGYDAILLRAGDGKPHDMLSGLTEAEREQELDMLAGQWGLSRDQLTDRDIEDLRHIVDDQYIILNRSALVVDADTSDISRDVRTLRTPTKKAAPGKAVPAKATAVLPESLPIGFRRKPDESLTEGDSWTVGRRTIALLDAWDGKGRDPLKSYDREQLRAAADQLELRVDEHASSAQLRDAITKYHASLKGKHRATDEPAYEDAAKRKVSRPAPRPRGAAPSASPRQALTSARSTSAVGKAASAEAKRITGRDISFDLGESDVGIAREHSEGILRALEAFPDARLAGVRLADLQGSHRHADDGGATWGRAVPQEDGTWWIEFDTGFSSPDGVEDYRRSVEGSSRVGRTGRANTAGTPMGVALHEMGHVVDSPVGFDGQLGRIARTFTNEHLEAIGYHPHVVGTSDEIASARARRRLAISFDLSRYAMKNDMELAAEVFADVLHNGDEASELSRAIFDAFEDLLREAK